MAKQLNVNLAFTANTAAAKQQIQSLQQSLDSLIANSVKSQQLPITKQLTEAQTAAASLKVALDSAINVNTGKLDLSKFSESINKSGLNLRTLRDNLMNLGPSGAQTFQQLTQSIMSAEVSLTRANTLTTQLWTSLKNTARWQISSSILHGFMGTIQSAFGYAQDLNGALNDIRIVTGQSVDEMSKFAEKATKAAKALSTTTTAYAKASLIYYQQGLSADEVEKRADVTTKLANVTGQSEQAVSEQMTAIWNNFAKGGESLEYYADVITALGAATASSSDEISQGLEKFAAVAETVGLSYEFATSALATVTATTRQSADVVGTAFKTLFARIQDLELGKTLDDGTTLGTYSAALEKIGINIKDSSGNLKEMDNILVEMGAKWETLNKDQQVALAQSVAGVRQYTQLIALMDNWDFMESNLSTAENASGKLQEQADIYAESWEAASKRVKASAQDIYDSIINDEFFISLMNGFSSILDFVGDLVDSLGGLPGVLGLLGTIMTKLFGKQMADSIENLVYGIRSLHGDTQRAAEQQKKEAFELAKEINLNDGSAGGEAANAAMKNQLKLQEELMDKASRMTEEEKKRYAVLLDVNKQYGEQAILAGKAVDAAQMKIQTSNRGLRKEALRNGTDAETYGDAREKMRNQAVNVAAADTNLKKLNAEIQSKDIIDYSSYIDKINKSLSSLGKNNTTANAIKKLNQQFRTGQIDSDTYKKKLNQLATSGELIDDAVMHMSDSFIDSVPALSNSTKAVDGLAQEEIEAALASDQFKQKMAELNQNTNNVKIAIEGFKQAMSGYSTVIVSAFQGVSQLTMGVNGIISAIDTWNNEDMSFGEKFISITMSMSMAIPALIGGYKALFVEKQKDNMCTMQSLALKTKEIAVAGAMATWNGILAASKAILTLFVGAETVAVWANTAAWYANPIMWIAAIIIGVIAAIAGLVAWFIISNNTLSENEKELANAEESLENLTAAYDRAKQKAEEFKEAVSNYEEARSGLKELEKGTAEYTEQLIKANEEASELIRKFSKELQGKYEVVAGEIIIDPNALDGIQDQLNDQVLSTAFSKNRGEIRVAEAKYNVDKDKILEGSDYSKDYSYSTIDYQKKWLDHYEKLSKEEKQAVTKEDIAGFIQDVASQNGFSLSEDVVSDMSSGLMTTTESLDALNAENQANTEALHANTEALVGQKYSKEATSEYGAAALAGAEAILAEQKQGDFQGSGKTATDYFKAANLNGGLFDNNDLVDSTLTRQEKEWLAQLGGVEYSKISDGELEYDSDSGWTLYDNDGNSLGNWSADDFNELMSQFAGSIPTEQEVLEYLNSEQNVEAAEEYAKDNLGYKAEDLQQRTGDFAGITSGQAQKLEDRDFGKYEGEVSEYFKNLPAEIKGSMANTLENLKVEDIEKAGSVEKAVAKEENKALVKSYSTELGMSEDAFSAYTDEIVKNNKALEDNDILATKVAKKAIENSRKVKKLGESYADLKEDLDKNKKGTEDFYTACNKMATGLNSVFGDGAFDAKLVEDNLDTVKKAMEGDVAAMQQLQDLAGEQLLIDANVDLSDGSLGDQVNDWIGSQEFNDLQIGATLDDSGMTSVFQQMLNNGQLTVDELNNVLNGIGFDPQVDYVTVPMENAVLDKDTNTYTATYEDPVTGEQVTKQISAENVTQAEGGGAIQIPVINGEGTTKISTPKSLAQSALGGSGGNGGGGGNKSKKEHKKKSDEIERYHTTNKQKEQNKRKQDSASAKKDFAYGRDKLQYLDEEIAAFEEGIELQEQYQAAVQKNLETDWNAIEHFGFTKDKDGIITNWEEIMEQELAKYNAAVDAYNKNGNEKAFEAAEKRYEEFKELVEQYEETEQLLDEAVDEAAEQQRELIRKKLEKITTEIDFEIEINERDLKRLEYIVDKLSRTPEKLIETIAVYSQMMTNEQNRFDWIAAGIQEVYDKAEDKNKLSQDEKEQIYKWQDMGLDNAKSLMDMIEKVSETLTTEFERLNSEISESIDNFDAYNSVLDHFTNIIRLSGRSIQDSDLIKKLSDQKTDTAMAQLTAQGQLYDFNMKAKEEAAVKKQNADNALSALKEDARYNKYIEIKNKDVGDRTEDEKEFLKTEAEFIAKVKAAEADVEYWNDQFEAISQAAEESYEAVIAAWESALQSAEDEFNQSIEQTVETLKRSLGENGLDFMADEYEKRKTVQDQYLSQLDKEYELNKLNRQIQSSIDGTDNVRAKQALNKLQDEINAKLAKGVELSKYDLEYMQKQYDVEMARIALEEAQNAKSTVRLTRDSEGNFGYVYTADEDKVADAQQNYEDKLYESQKLGEDYINEMSDMIIQNQQEMVDALAAIDKNAYETEEEYLAEVDRVKQYYLDRDAYLRSEMEKAMQHTGVVYEETVLGQLEGASSLEEGHNNLVTNVETATTAMGEAWKEWKTDVDTATGLANEALGTVGDKATDVRGIVETEADAIGTKMGELSGKIETETGNAKTHFSNMLIEVSNWREKYVAQIQLIIDKYEELAGISGNQLTDQQPPKGTETGDKGKGDETGNEGKGTETGNEGKGTETGGNEKTYTVKKGDSLSKIAKDLGIKGGWQALYEANKDVIGSDPNKIYEGQVFKIPGTTDTGGNTGGNTGGEVAEQDPPKSPDTPKNWMFRISSSNNSSTIYDSAFDYSTQDEAKIAGQSYVQGKKLRSTVVETYSRGKVPAKVVSNNLPLNKPITFKESTAEFQRYKKRSDGTIDAITSSVGKFSAYKTMTLYERANYKGEDYYCYATNNWWIKESDLLPQVKSYDTGGYTGEWGPEGKLAMLHQKELILNADDTENFLLGIQMLRSISDILERNASLASMTSSNLSAYTLSNSFGQALEQQVTIQAEFPNVSDHNEIEIAIDNLINRASQFAYKS